MIFEDNLSTDEAKKFIIEQLDLIVHELHENHNPEQIAVILNGLVKNTSVLAADMRDVFLRHCVRAGWTPTNFEKTYPGISKSTVSRAARNHR